MQTYGLSIKKGHLMVILNPAQQRYEAQVTGHDLRRIITVKNHLESLLGERIGHPLLEPLIDGDLHQPYHNLQHAFTVAINAMRIADSVAMPRMDRAVLLVAALYHDFGHSAGELTDDENIRIAVEGVRQHLTPALGSPFVDAVVDLIPITEYPFTREPESLCEKVLRDADLLQHFEPDGERFTKGLAEELGFEITRESTVTFLMAQQMYTEAGRIAMHAGLQKLRPYH